MYPFIILCGGFATRLGEIAVETPKCLLKLNNKPFLLYQLEYLDKNGAKDVFLSVLSFLLPIIRAQGIP